MHFSGVKTTNIEDKSVNTEIFKFPYSAGFLDKNSNLFTELVEYYISALQKCSGT